MHRFHFLFLLLTALRLPAADGPPALITEEEARKAFREFPRAYWYACDTWTKSIHGGGGFGDPVTSAERGKLVNFALSNAATQPTVKFTLEEKTEDGEVGMTANFVFVQVKGNWRAMKGWREERGRVIDLYSNSFMAPSMQRFVDAEVQKLMRQEGIYSPILQQAAISPPAYTSLIGEELSGSGFHLSYKGKRFAVCTLHQFDLKTPAKFIGGDLETEIPVLKRVHQQTDIQVVTYRSDWLDGKPPLVYEPQPKPLEVGEPVFILNHDQWLAAHVVTQSITGIKLAPEKPFPAAGLSGSPVISGTTGLAVAVLTGADSPSAAKVVECLELELPLSLLEELPVDAIPDKIFGVPAKAKPDTELASLVQSRLIHPRAFRYELGNSREELPNKGNSTSSGAVKPDPATLTGREAFSSDYLMPIFTCGKEAGSFSELSLGSLRSPTEEELVKLTQFILCYFGPPSRVFERDYSKSPGADLLGCYWTSEQFSAVLQISGRGWDEQKVALYARAGRHDLEEIVYTAGATPAAWPPEELGSRIGKWFGDLKERTRRKN